MTMPHSSAELLRKRMVNTHLKARGINNNRVLEVMGALPRELFGSFTSNEQAYGDFAHGIDCEQTISQPYIVALMTQALDVMPHHRVLEIGTGSGYQTAVLAQLCQHVTTIERHAPLSHQAQERLKHLGLHNIEFRVDQGIHGVPELAPFDRIMVTAVSSRFPQGLFDQLDPDGGVMVYPQEHLDGQQILYRLVRNDPGQPSITSLGEVRFVPLVEDPR